MLEHIDTINLLSSKIYALLDLIQCCDEDCVDVDSLKLAAQMCVTMQDELLAEVGKIECKCNELYRSITDGKTITW